jgi:hypothetical protein
LTVLWCAVSFFSPNSVLKLTPKSCFMVISVSGPLNKNVDGSTGSETSCLPGQDVSRLRVYVGTSCEPEGLLPA